MVRKFFKTVINYFKRKYYRIDQRIVTVSTGSTIIRTRLMHSKYDRVVHVPDHKKVRIQALRQRCNCKYYREVNYKC